MAGIVSRIQDIGASKFVIQDGLTWGEVIDGEVDQEFFTPPLRNGILGGGILNSNIPSSSGTATKWRAWHDAHATISGYEQLRTTTQGLPSEHSCTAQTLNECAIEQYATTSGDMDDVRITTLSTMDWSIRAKRDSSTSENSHIELNLYHRTSGGTETLMDSVITGNLTTSFVTYTGNWSVSTDFYFAPGSFLVFKYINVNTGVPP